MSHELLYTSAPRGLRPGSRGFCTVLSTQGLPATLVDRLEALSGYRHVFPPQTPQARLNPVVSSHLVLSAGGRPWHVLSRVCDAGLDYSQRTNKLAHHVLLDANELPLAGPAWLLSQPGFMQATWDGQPRVLPGGRRPPMADTPPGVCRQWQQVCGDAGWGGVLAETALNGRTALLVFRPGTDPLPLLSEALALLPPEQRWNVTFSTCYTRLPAGVECQWRCVLEGSPEAMSASRPPQALVIDLLRPAPLPSRGPWVQAACAGTIVSVSQTSTSAWPRLPADRGAPDILRELSDEAGLRIATSPSRLAGFPPTVLPPLPAGPRSGARFNPRHKTGPRWPWFLAAAAVVVIALGGATFWLATHSRSKTIAKNTSEIDERETNEYEIDEHEIEDLLAGLVLIESLNSGSPETNPQGEDERKLAIRGDLNIDDLEIERLISEMLADDSRETSHPNEREEITPSRPSTRTTAQTAKPKAPPKPRPEARVVEIPPYPSAEYDTNGRAINLLASKSWREDSSLALLFNGIAFDAGRSFEVKRVFEKPFHWQCYAHNQGDRRVVADFTINDHGLQFAWSDRVGRIGEAWKLNQLRNCVLRITNGQVRHDIALRTPFHGPILALHDAPPNKFKPFPITGIKDMPSAELQIEIVEGELKPSDKPGEESGSREVSVSVNDIEARFVVVLDKTNKASPLIRLKYLGLWRGGRAPDPLTPEEAQTKLKNAKDNLTRIRKETDRPSNNPHDQEAAQKELQTAQTNCDNAKQDHKSAVAAWKLPKELDGKHLDYRIVYYAEDCKVVLISSRLDGK